MSLINLKKSFDMTPWFLRVQVSLNLHFELSDLWKKYKSEFQFSCYSCINTTSLLISDQVDLNCTLYLLMYLFILREVWTMGRKKKKKSQTLHFLIHIFLPYTVYNVLCEYGSYKNFLLLVYAPWQQGTDSRPLPPSLPLVYILCGTACNTVRLVMHI